LIFIKKGGEIRLSETLATNPGKFWKTVPKPNPGKTGDDKNKHGNNENFSFGSKKLHPAYGHGVVKILIWK
jgi:hypothetical protein